MHLLQSPLHSAPLVAFALLIGCSATDSESISNAGASASGSPAMAGGGASASAGSASNLGGSSYGAGGTVSQNIAGQPSGGAANGGAGAGGAAGTASGGIPGAGGAPSGGASGGLGGRANGDGGAGGSSGGSSGGTPGVRIVGRSAGGNSGALRFSWPGVSINARFTGTQVSMNVNDGNNKNRFTVVVDGGAPKTVTTSGQAQLALATGLSNGSHDLVVWRNTEASMGVTEFMGLTGFGTGGALLPAAAAPDRRIEVIGDSLSVAAGVEGTSTTCNPSIDAFTNNYLAYGSVAARTVKADIVTIAWSGIGVYVSYGGTAPTMPARYDYAIPNDNTAWDFSKYQPHVVVLNLGTNDFANGNPGQPYVDAYVSFIKHVRSKYAAAKLVLIDMYGGDRLTAINSVVSTLKNGGEASVEALSFSSVPNNNTACNSHPNTAAQSAMGSILATRLKSLMGW